MDFDNFVLMGGSNGEVMAGGYIINSRLLVPSMSGGKNKNKKDKEEEEEKEVQYSIPPGLLYVDIPHRESSVEIIYGNYDALPDDIYDNLYNSATFMTTDKITDDKNSKNIKNNNNNKKNTKKKKINSSKKTRKHK